MVAENFQIYSVKITSKYICAPKNYVQKKNLFIFNHAPKQNSPQAKRKLPIPREQRFLKIFFLGQKGGEGVTEDYGAEKNTKIYKGIGQSFEKSYHLCNLYIFGLCFVVQ